MATGGEDVGRKVAELRQALEREIESEARPVFGCWPLAVGAAGVLLGAVLLLRAC